MLRSINQSLPAALLLVASPSPLAAQSTYEQRHDAYFDDISTRGINLTQTSGPHRAGRTGFWTTQGKLQRGNESSGVWSQLSYVIANADGSADAGGANGGFSGWPGMDTYLRWQHRFPQSIKDQYYTEYTTMPTYGNGSTPNQRIMWAAACKLACETWGTAAVTSVSNAANRYGDPTGKAYMMAICDRTVKYNFEERWAKHYLQYTLGPLRSIADLSNDPELVNRARMTWNWGWMDIASFSFKGRWAIPAGRGSLVQDGNSSDISEFGSWLMFEGTPRANPLDMDQSLLYTQPKVGQANLVTQPPIIPEMLEAATDRSKPFTRRGFARVHETQFATSYLTKDWTLYSQLEADTTLNSDGTLKIKDLDNGGVPSNDWSSERWAVMWDETGTAGLTMKAPTGYGWCQGCGLGPHEDIVQHEGTIAGIFNIPTTSNWQYTRDYIPTNTTAVINDSATTGRLYLHYSKVLVAITRSDIGNFTWPPASQTFCNKRGYAVECASLDEYPQSTAAARLAAFKADIEANPPDFSHVNDLIPRMIYTTRDGTVLDVTYGQGGKINNDPVDYTSWPLHESPWARQDQMGNMWVFGKDRHLLWNYKNWTERSDYRPTAITSAPVAAAASVDIDLSTRVSDTETPAANLNYRITGSNNGSAVILADGKTARFTPAANLAGESNFTFTAGGEFPDQRFIFHYDYEQPDPLAGGIVKDQSTNDRHATASVGGFASFTGEPDQPAALASHDSQSLRVVSSNFGSAKLSRQIQPATLNFSNHDWTFATWFKRDSYADEDFLFYIGNSDGNSGSVDELQLFLPAQSKTLSLKHWTTANVNDVNLSTASIVETGVWHHVAVQYDRTSLNTGVMKLFLNGKLVATSAPLTFALDQTGPVFIGGPAANTVLNRNFNGWLDDTVLARGELSTDEIDALASATASHLGGVKLAQTVRFIASPLAPTSLAATASNNTIQLAWSASSGVAGYTVKRATSAAGPFITLASGITGTSFVDLTAAFGTTYHYVVTASNSSGESTGSNVASAQLPATDPSIWNGGTMAAWSRGARIAFPGYTNSETLTDIALLVRIDAANVPGFSYSQFAFANGADLRFTDASGTTELPYEIEKWDPAGTSLVWVKVPSLTSATSILAFWGNPAATAPAYNGSTWTGGYTGVWHLNSTTVTDSTVPQQNTTSNATLTSSGKVASALVHNGTSQHAIIPNATELNLSNNYELSGWFKLAAADKPASGNYRSLFTKETDSNTRNWWLSINSDGRLWWKSSAGIDVTSPTDLADNQWHHFSAVHDGSTARLYLDGVEVVTGGAPANEELTTWAVRLGSENSTRWFKGTLDEFRIANVKRSAAWIRAVYDNINNPAFIRIAPATPYAAAFAPRLAHLPATAVTSTSANLNGTLVSTGGSTTTVTIYHGSSDGGTTPANWAGSLNLGTRPVGNFGGAISGLPVGSVRYFRAFASNATGGTWAPATSSFITPTAAPAGLAAVPTSGLVSLSWSATPGATSYHLKRATSPGGPYTPVISGILGNTASDPSAAIGTSYYYVISASNPGGESANSAELAITTLAAPVTLTATAGNNSVALSWNAVAGATSYTLQRATSPGGPFTTLASGIGGTSRSDTTALNGNAYFYQLTALNAGYESEPSSIATATPSASIDAPTGLAGAPVSTGANLTWNPVAGATHYRVKRSTTSGGPYTTIANNLLAPSHGDTGLTNGTTYFYVVSAFNGSIESANSAQISVVPAVPPTTFTTASAGNWSSATWTPQQPISAFATTIVFNNAGSISSNNNLGLLLANKLNLTNGAVNLTGDALFLAGSAPAVTSTANVAHTLGGILTLDAATTFNIPSNTTTVSGVINGNGGVTKTGAGTLVLTGANSNTGPTTVSAGVLNLRHSDALGSSNITVANGASLDLQNNITLTGHRATLTGQGSGTGGVLRNVSGDNTWAGEITAIADSGVTRISSDAGTLTLSGEINQDNGSSDQLVFQGSGNTVVTGAIDGNSDVTRSSAGSGVVSFLGENTYTGQTLVNGGILEINSLNSLIGEEGDEEVALSASSLGLPTSVANATINLGYTSTTATLRFIGPTTKTDRVLNLAGTSGGAVIEQNGSGKLTFLSALTATGAGSKALTLTGTSEGLLAGAIVDNSSSNKTNLTKSGTGLWTLGGANTYTGTTNVNAGTLLLQNASIAAGGNVTVATSATFGGSGSVTPNSTINGNLALTPGTLTFSGTLAFGASARMKWNLTENSAITGFGQVSAPAANLTTGAVVDVILNPTDGTANFANSFWSSPRTWPVLTALARSGNFTLGTISADSAGHPASGYGSFAIEQTPTGVNLTWTPLSPIEQWRFTHFGVTTGTGNAADSADPDGDGANNLAEFNNGTDPLRAPAPTVSITSPASEPVTVASLADSLHLIATSTAAAPLWSWSQTSGPGTVSFENTASSVTRVNFSEPGQYIIEASATVGSGNFAVTGTATRTVIVAQPANLLLRQTDGGYQHSATFVRGDNPTWNSGGRNQILAGKSSGTGIFRTLFAFDLSGIPAGAIVRSAALDLWTADEAGTAGGIVSSVELRRLTTPFTEGTGISTSGANADTTSGANWTRRSDSASNLPWNNDGGSAGSDLLATYPSWATGDLNAPRTFASTPELTAAVNSGLAEGTVHFVIRASSPDETGTSNAFTRIHSDDSTDITRRPALRLGFTANPAPVIATGPAPAATSGSPANLTGSSSGATTTAWSLVSGPGTATFADPNNPATTVTFSQPGSYTLRLLSSNAHGTVSRTLAVNAISVTPIDPAVFTDWQQLTWPGETNTNIIGPDADPDGDGLTNIVEWALHLDPKQPTAFVPVLARNGLSLEFTYIRRKTAPGAAAWQAEWSDTLGEDWSAAGITEAPAVGLSPETESVTLTLPAGPAGRRFVRLRLVVP
jgi:autotransporter-associated beta strand protein